MKPKLPSLLLILPFILLAACKEATQPVAEPDALGLRWGMSSTDVFAAYPEITDLLSRDGEIVGHVRGTIKLLDRDWELRTLDEGEGGLQKVQLIFEASDKEDCDLIHSQMWLLLHQKYGNPISAKNEHETIWGTPRTSIYLDKDYFGKAVKLTYSARPGYADLDKL